LADHAEYKAWADQIVTGVKFLNNIVTNMLTFTRLSRPQVGPLNAAEVVLDTLAFIEPVLRQRKIRVERPEVGNGAAFCMGDQGMLRQMLLNLFMNALQAMPEGGRLAVRVECGGPGTLKLEVEDSGIGISDENLSRIFDPFFTTNEKGTGLGLALVHQIVEQHHGRVEAQSGFGKGTRFTIWLPEAQGPAIEGRSASRRGSKRYSQGHQ
jgi:two-component system sensor histidine kinase HydH